jgi:hypothetical protein
MYGKVCRTVAQEEWYRMCRALANICNLEASIIIIMLRKQKEYDDCFPYACFQAVAANLNSRPNTVWYLVAIWHLLHSCERFLFLKRKANLSGLVDIEYMKLTLSHP